MRIMILAAIMLLATPAYAQNVSKGDIQRLDDLTMDITGGTIDGAVIGGTTPAAVTGTTLNFTALGEGASEEEIDRASDPSDRAVFLNGGTETITAALHGDRIMFLSNCQGTQAVTLPDGGTATGERYKFVMGCAGTNALTIAVPSGDDTSMRGIISGVQSGGVVAYSSAAVALGSDTITLTSAAAGSTVELLFGSASTIFVEGDVFLSQGSGATLFSSAVASP